MYTVNYRKYMYSYIDTSTVHLVKCARHMQKLCKKLVVTYLYQVSEEENVIYKGGN